VLLNDQINKEGNTKRRRAKKKIKNAGVLFRHFKNYI